MGWLFAAALAFHRAHRFVGVDPTDQGSASTSYKGLPAGHQMQHGSCVTLAARFSSPGVSMDGGFADISGCSKKEAATGLTAKAPHPPQADRRTFIRRDATR